MPSRGLPVPTNPRSAPMTTPTAPDQVVRLLATDGYDVHRLIYEAFVTAGGRDFLYAPFAGGGGFHAVFVRRFDVQTRFAAGMQFAMTLRAMPAVKANGRRRSIGAARATREGRAQAALDRGPRPRARLHAAGDPRDARRARAPRGGQDAIRIQRLHLPRPDSSHRRGAVHPRLHPRDRTGQGVGLCNADSSRGLNDMTTYLFTGALITRVSTVRDNGLKKARMD